MIETFLSDLRYGIRVLIKNPSFAAVAVLSLALGIGANTAIFSVVNAVVLRPLPYKNPDRLMSVQRIEQKRTGGTELSTVWSYPKFVALRDQNDIFEQVAAYSQSAYTLTGTDNPERVVTEFVSASYFPMLGLDAIFGRTFTPEEDKTPNTSPVAVISHGLWERRFGSAPEVIGKTITLEKATLTIIGVLPESFKGQSGIVDVWVPMMMVPSLVFPRRLSQAHAHWHEVIALLKPGVSQPQARAALEITAKKMTAAVPLLAGMTPDGVTVVPLREANLDPSIKKSLLILLGAVAFVLLLACVNIANLLMARAVKRQKEIAVRLALGATRNRLIRQLLTESILLAVLGGTAGLLVAKLGIALLAIVKPSSNPAFKAKDLQTLNFAAANLDVQVLVFNFGLAIITGLLFGLVPAFQASRSDFNDSLKDSLAASAVTCGLWRQLNPKNILVIAEITLSLVLLVSAGLMIRSFARMQSVQIGFTPNDLITLKIDLPAKYNATAFYEQLTARAEAIPGVTAASVTNKVPLSSSPCRTAMKIDGVTSPPDAEPPLVGCVSVGPYYFKTLRVPVIHGRVFTDQDREGAQRVAVINEAAARKYWPNESPLGKRIRLSIGWEPADDWAEIIGIVGDVKYGKVEEAVQPDVYLSYLQPTEPSSFLVVRAASPVSLVPALRQTVLSIDRNLAVYDIKTMHERIADATSQTRFSALLLGLFATVALILAAIGIYGVMSYAISARIREIGIRMALGAQPADVLRLVIGNGLIIILIGVAIGILAAIGATNVLASQLFGIGATDPFTFVVISALLIGVALLVCYLPARRATKVDPMIALRYE